MESSQSSSALDVPVTCTEERLHQLQEQQQQGEEQGRGQGQGGGAKEKEKECVHRTKVIQFLGRTTPFVLQNDNGPCPLLAICNVLLLKNSLNLSPDVAEVSQEKLLSLVAEQLIDSNSNINNKDAGYVENQQQNIADAIDLLPRLATGIDVNIKFRRIDDFEFTSECAIFDLLDIPLYHGWIVDSQDDAAAANAIGFKSYNALMADLVGLETFSMEKMPSPLSEEETVDFAAATTAALGVPSPSLSKVRSFDTPPQSVPDCALRKGDQEEEAELMRALRLSETEMLSSMGDSVPVGPACGTSVNVADTTEKVSLTNTAGALQYCGNELSSNTISGPASAGTAVATSCILIPEIVVTGCHGPSEGLQPGGVSPSIDVSNLTDQRTVNAIGAISISVTQQDNLMSEELDRVSHKSEMFEKPPLSLHSPGEATDSYCRHDPENVSSFSAHPPPSFSGSRSDNIPELCASVIDGSEPIYEGEECILDSGTSCDDKEPIYEGEVVLAIQSDNHSGGNPEVGDEDKITPQQGEIIKNFLRNSASQLTNYGLFSLQKGLKERELCVFFRNNHFSTMFKYEGELYLLATDQGYLNQPDLAWEKLNKVNGDTLFVTSNFKEFKMESPSSETWDEHNAMASTADYLANFDGSTHAGLDMNSDLQLAIALQQEEFEQQQQQQQQQQPQQRNSVQQSSLGGSSLVTAPQVGRYAGKNPPSSSRVDSKSKGRCSIL